MITSYLTGIGCREIDSKARHGQLGAGVAAGRPARPSGARTRAAAISRRTAGAASAGVGGRLGAAPARAAVRTKRNEACSARADQRALTAAERVEAPAELRWTSCQVTDSSSRRCGAPRARRSGRCSAPRCSRCACAQLAAVVAELLVRRSSLDLGAAVLADARLPGAARSRSARRAHVGGPLRGSAFSGDPLAASRSASRSSSTPASASVELRAGVASASSKRPPRRYSGAAVRPARHSSPVALDEEVAAPPLAARRCVERPHVRAGDRPLAPAATCAKCSPSSRGTLSCDSSRYVERVAAASPPPRCTRADPASTSRAGHRREHARRSRRSRVLRRRRARSSRTRRPRRSCPSRTRDRSRASPTLERGSRRVVEPAVLDRRSSTSTPTTSRPRSARIAAPKPSPLPRSSTRRPATSSAAHR